MAPSAAATATGRPTEPRRPAWQPLTAFLCACIRPKPNQTRHSQLLKGAALAPTGCRVVEARGAKDLFGGAGARMHVEDAHAEHAAQLAAPAPQRQVVVGPRLRRARLFRARTAAACS